MPRPWRQIAVPHEDVLNKGSFQQSEFAADIFPTHPGVATLEYPHLVCYFARTRLTDIFRSIWKSSATMDTD